VAVEDAGGLDVLWPRGVRELREALGGHGVIVARGADGAHRRDGTDEHELQHKAKCGDDQHDWPELTLTRRSASRDTVDALGTFHDTSELCFVV